ncbi:MAG TPA: bifunctional glutamate N-acetyltransferase/amino-acid acetyltransferase ArgJ [Thermoplasmata archaeon]|nr:bifunctional glutamate N-acetyltransferase/amino-acid acetyltransferase ArgJ [Thermoplasmata archaeon]
MEFVPRSVTYPKGFTASATTAGIKRSGRPDLALILSDRPATAAGVFTTNVVRAAPVLLGEEILARGPDGVRGILALSGVANAMTGPAGIADNRTILEATELAAGVPAGTLLPACTGVIGPRIPTDRVLPAVPALTRGLAHSREADRHAAHAILTTDTHAKSVALRGRLADGTVVHLGGIAKGSGMIAPRMSLPHATTLAFLTTDARVSAGAMGRLLSNATDRTFNMVSVDGDTSTNDTIYLLANGAAGGASAENDPTFRTMVATALESLARAVARDGEGATKLLTVTVRGAKTLQDARAAAKAVVGSTLVKAAVFGADPNVGRIACALGYSGARLDPDRIDVTLRAGRGELPLIVDGRPAPGMENGQGKRVREMLLRASEVPLDIRLHEGRASATAWGCDLSYSYVQINAAYHT